MLNLTLMIPDGYNGNKYGYLFSGRRETYHPIIKKVTRPLNCPTRETIPLLPKILKMMTIKAMKIPNMTDQWSQIYIAKIFHINLASCSQLKLWCANCFDMPSVLCQIFFYSTSLLFFMLPFVIVIILLSIYNFFTCIALRFHRQAVLC